jgi:hypothetical protein
MANFELPTSEKDIKVLSLSESARKTEGFAKFDLAIEESDLRFLLGNGLKGAAHRAAHCLGWVWRQWLMGVPSKAFSSRLERFVDRGLELRARSTSYHMLAVHDLYLLHCAIFASGPAQLRKVAEQIRRCIRRQRSNARE